MEAWKELEIKDRLLMKVHNMCLKTARKLGKSDDEIKRYVYNVLGRELGEKNHAN